MKKIVLIAAFILGFNFVSVAQESKKQNVSIEQAKEDILKNVTELQRITGINAQLKDDLINLLLNREIALQSANQEDKKEIFIKYGNKLKGAFTPEQLEAISVKNPKVLADLTEYKE